MRRLRFRAGRRLLPRLMDAGLKPSDVRVVPGAAGGPKWLVLAELDRFIFGNWLKTSGEPVDLVGASAGAWRFAAAAQQDPAAALDRLKDAYIHQSYSAKPPLAEVTAQCRKIIGSFAGERAAEEILSNPHLRLQVVTARSRHLTGSDAKPVAAIGFGAAAAFNALSRKALGLFQERVVFHHPEAAPVMDEGGGLAVTRVMLTAGNLQEALLASGAIPFLSERVAAPAGAPPGWYRDGGLTDYHFDFAWRVKEGEAVLYPHFSHEIVPGWLDKTLFWRRAGAESLKDVLLVSPSDEFVASLPMKKIPDRSDFYTFKGRDAERFRLWEETAARCRELADEFAEAVEGVKLREWVEPA